MLAPAAKSFPAAIGRKPLLQIQGLGVRYGSHWALRDFDLDVHQGDMVGIIGPNGGGKSTFGSDVILEDIGDDQVRAARQPGDRPDHRRLPGPVRPDQPHPLALGDLEVDVAHDGPPSEPNGDAARRDRAPGR